MIIRLNPTSAWPKYYSQYGEKYRAHKEEASPVTERYFKTLIENKIIPEGAELIYAEADYKDLLRQIKESWELGHTPEDDPAVYRKLKAILEDE